MQIFQIVLYSTQSRLEIHFHLIKRFSQEYQMLWMEELRPHTHSGLIWITSGRLMCSFVMGYSKCCEGQTLSKR